MDTIPYKKIHVVINPAAGKDEPILNTLNKLFSQYEVDWSVSVTRAFGEATQFARQAAENGADLVAAYGGDGTQHEVANGLRGTTAVMGVLPGGTGNGFAAELGTPNDLHAATELLCTSHNRRQIDMVQIGSTFFTQRLYIGTEPEEQTSREDKDRFGAFAYVLDTYRRNLNRSDTEVQYRVHIDDDYIEMPASKLYVVNGAKAGAGFSVTGNFSSPDDGLLELFVIDTNNLKTLVAALERVVNLQTEMAQQFIWQGKEIRIETDPDQPVWIDGEYYGRTPIHLKIIPGALTVAVP